MNNLDPIQKMTTGELVEATLFVLNAVALDTDEEFSVPELSQLSGDPYKHIRSIEKLCRVILINASNRPEYQELVDDAINNVGKKNSMITGTEVTLLIGGIGALALIINPKESEETTFYDENGKKVTKKIKYQNLGKFIASLINAILGNTGDANDDKK